MGLSKNARKVLASGLLATTVFTMGCGGAAQTASTGETTAPAQENADASATGEDGKVELRYLLWGNQEEIEFKQKFTDAFNAQNDHIHVNLEAIPEGFHEKLTVQVSSNTLADMVQIAGDFGGEYFKEGYFEPLDSYIEADGLQDAWADSVMGGLTYDGKVYAAPLTFNSGFLQ